MPRLPTHIAGMIATGVLGTLAGSASTYALLSTHEVAPVGHQAPAPSQNKPHSAPPTPGTFRASARPGSGNGASLNQEGQTGTSATAQGAQQAAQPNVYAAKMENLTSELSHLRTELEKAEQLRADDKTYDLSTAKLRELAERCELRWDMPSMLPYPPTLTNELVDTLALSPSERQAANQVFESNHSRLLASIQQAYVELTGDTQTGSMSHKAMLEEIMDKQPRRTLQAVFQSLAQERAGLRPSPADPSRSSPLERLMRTMTGLGDIMETELSEKLGAERAHLLRDTKKGWDSQHRSSYGCP